MDKDRHTNYEDWHEDCGVCWDCEICGKLNLLKWRKDDEVLASPEELTEKLNELLGGSSKLMSKEEYKSVVFKVYALVRYLLY